MQEGAREFYDSKRWKDCRASYLKKVKGLCENCLAQGRYTPAKIVHHIEFINPSNVTNPEVTLNYDNLQALCLDCHNEIHIKGMRRYRIDEDGKVTAR